MDVSSILDSLNPSQREAVAAPDRNVMVLAGAGSGKTSVLVHRIAWYIKTGQCSPFNILAVTFTNKAATEMRSRINRLLDHPAGNMWVGTFHGLNHRILRANWQVAGLPQDFTILDSEDQYRTIRRVLKAMSVDESHFPPREVQWFINAKKDAGLRPQHINDQDDHHVHQMIRIYQAYEDVCNRSGVVDFSELLLRTHELLRDHQDILERYRQRFTCILVDEFQDTNALQYAWLRLLAGKQGHMFAVGDDDQCLHHSTTVTMADGSYRPIADLNIDDQVLSNVGNGHFASAKVTECFRRPYQGMMVSIHLQGGQMIKSTFEHTHFAGYIAGKSPQTFLTCLLYKQASGYYLYPSCVYGAEQDYSTLEFQQQLVQQQADALWIIRTYENRIQAIADLDVIVRQYGWLDHHDVDGEHLLEDMGLSVQHPHYLTQQQPCGRNPLVITLCIGHDVDHRYATRHRMSMSGVKEYDRHILQSLQLGDHLYQKDDHWILVVEDHEFGKLMKIADQIRKALNTSMLLNGQMLEQCLPFIQAINIRQGMIMATDSGSYAVVDHVELVNEKTWICDLNVDSTHNFIANSIVTHNSIYSWRGAQIENMQKFKEDFPNPLLVKLEQNYRSTTNILNAANALIANNKTRIGKKLWAAGDCGAKIALYNAYNEQDEARYVAEQINSRYRETDRYQDSAIFYRVSAQSRVIEEQLMRANIPYKVYGGLRFYERAEIKNALSYLRLSVSHNDSVSFERIVNTPTRGIGQRSLAILRDLAHQQECSLWQATQYVLQQQILTTRAASALQAFLDLITQMGANQTLPLHELVDTVIQASGLIESYSNERGERGLARIDNMEELVRAAEAFEDHEASEDMSPLQAFLAHASLEAGDHQSKQHNDFVSLMTLHAAKGLEFDNVYLVGIEEGLFPHQRNIADLLMLEEERRLCYVGITRAKQSLTMTYAEHRRLHGKDYYPLPSRFIKELPTELIDEIRMGGKVIEPMFDHSTLTTSNVDSKPIKNSQQTRYTLGQDVSHATFGNGTILALENEGKNIKVEVKFERVGNKWLIAEYANLVII